MIFDPDRLRKLAGETGEKKRLHLEAKAEYEAQEKLLKTILSSIEAKYRSQTERPSEAKIKSLALADKQYKEEVLKLKEYAYHAARADAEFISSSLMWQSEQSILSFEKERMKLDRSQT